MQAVKWVVAKLQGDKTASFCREMSGREVTGRKISIPVFYGTLLPMDFWTPPRFLKLGAHEGGHATARFLERFLEGSLKEVLLRRVLRRRLVRASIETGVLRRVLRGRGVVEGA